MTKTSRRGVALSCCMFIFQVTAFCQTGSNWVDGTLVEYINDGAWCWFQDERAVVDTAKNKLIVGSANMQASVDVIIYNIGTQRVESTKRFNRLSYTDDHNAPAVMVAANGNYLALWAHHYDQYNTHYSVFNGSSWAAEKTFNWSTIPGGTDYTIAYCNVYYLSKEKRVFNFSRANDKAPNFLYSEDDGNTWKFGGQLTTNNSNTYNKGYYKYWGNSVDRIDMVFTEEHPRDQTTSIYHGYIQGGKTYNTKGEVADEDIYDRTQMPMFEKFTKVFAHGTVVNGVTMGRCWQHDIARYSDSTIAILFKARANNSETDHRNFYARYDGNEWKVTYLGKAGTKMYDSEQDYTGLGALNPDDPNRIYLCSTFNPGNDNTAASSKREIWRGTTQDHGATWKWEPVTANSSMDNFRPIVPQWKPGKEAVLWFRGTYTTAQNFSSKIVGTFFDYDVVDVKKENHTLMVSQPDFKVTRMQPASHRISVRYTVPERLPVRLQVYSLSGRKLASLVNKVMAAGLYTLEWDTRNLTAGMFLVQISFGGTSQVIPVTVQE